MKSVLTSVADQPSRKIEVQQKTFGDVRIRVLGTNFCKLDNSITEAKHFVLSKNLGEILFQ